MKSIVLGVLMLLCLSQCAAAPTEPRAVLVLTEDIDVILGHPWPVGLRLVAYDNGLVIRQPGSPDPGKQPHFVWQQKSPTEIQALVAKAKAATLEGVELTKQNVPLPLHVGSTYLDYWDADKQAFVSLYAYGTPCAGSDEEAKKLWIAEMRPLTDPRFVKLCDDLLHLPLDGAEDWHPKEMVVSLSAGQTQSVDKLVPWPEDWPKKWWETDNYGYKEITLCVPVGAKPNPVTASILDPESETWKKSIAVNKVGSEWWIITNYAARIAMPYRVENWFSGPCSTDPRFR